MNGDNLLPNNISESSICNYQNVHIMIGSKKIKWNYAQYFVKKIKLIIDIV